MRTSNHTLLFIPSSAIMLAASAAAVFLSAGTALGQARCPYSISPGQTQFLNAAFSADVTPPQIRPVTQAGAAFTDENKVESVALIPLGLPVVSSKATGFAQLNYQFCVSSNPNTPATAHLHNFYFRLDLDIDGFTGDVAEEFSHDSLNDPGGDQWQLIAKCRHYYEFG